MMRRMKVLGLQLALSAVLVGCASQPSTIPVNQITPRAVAYDALDGWNKENVAALLPVFRAQCRRMGQLPPETVLGGVAAFPSGRHVSDWQGVCDALSSLPDSSAMTGDVLARQFIESWFQPYSLGVSAYFTGYYQPVVQASLTQGGDFQIPLYARPNDLVRARATDGTWQSGRWAGDRFEPYDDRKAINAGILKGRQLELAWLKSPVDLFFLQIQGSGRLQLPDGRQVAVGYGGSNGQPYVPIGREMMKEGLLSSRHVNMDSIRAWLNTHPEQAMPLMERNPNYVFFKWDQGGAILGPQGSFGVPLMPWHAVAIDHAAIPYGAPLWVKTTLQVPDDVESEGGAEATRTGHSESWAHLVFAQDVGTDIRGAGRADLFTGWDDKAAFVAGHLHESGKMIVLLPRQTPDTVSPVSVPSAGTP